MASLREEKFAQTKIDILNAFLAELKTKSLNEISVNEICRKVRISAGTFFNYFAGKAEVITYYAQIWSIKVRYNLSRIAQEKKQGIAGVYAIFGMQAEELAVNPAAMREITAERALSRENHPFNEMVGEEYRLLFPGMEGIEEIKGSDIVSLIVECLETAIKTGELSSATDVNGLLIDLLTAFFATHVTLWQMDIDIGKINEHYKRQLDAIFRMRK